MKTVSVIIPVYKVEPYLRQCVDSVLQQTYNDFEVILVDDGSPDNCPSICDSYAQQDAKVKVIHKKNGGLSSARNAGLVVASGEYVCFFDSDDYIETDMIEKLVSAIEEHGDDVCICGYYVDYYDKKENLISTQTVMPDFLYMKSEWPIKRYEQILGWCGYAWNKLYRLRALKEGQLFFEEGVSLVEDLLFNKQVLCNSAKVRFIPYSGYHYIQRERETLGIKYYENYFELKQRAIDAKCSILQMWCVEEKWIIQFYNDNYIDALWGTIKNIKRSYLSKQEQRAKVVALTKDKQMRQKLRKANPHNKIRKTKKRLLLFVAPGLLLKIVR